MLSWILVAFLTAQPTPATPVPTVDEVRTTAREMLQTMCGTACDVIDVKVKTKRAAPVGQPLPGFDDEPAARFVPSEIDLRVLFDAKLNAQYRKFVVDRLKHRIGELGLPVLVTEEVRPFPEPPPLPVEQPLPQPQQQQPQYQPPIIIQQPPQEPPKPLPEPAKVDLWETFILKLLEALPLLLLFGLLAWLILRVLKRMEEIQTKPPQALEKIEEEEQVLTPEIIEETTRGPNPLNGSRLPPPTVERLTGDLRNHRGSTRRIFRRLLTRGDHDSVARAVALLGDFVVKDLSQDPASRQALAAAGARTAEILRSPITDEESEELLRSIQAELVADRVAHRASDVRKDLETLLEWGPEAFAAMMSRVDDRLALLLLRHAPTHLSESYLSGLAPHDRAEMVRSLLSSPPAEPEEIEQLAEAIESNKDAAVVGGYEADHIVDLLDSLPAGEQEIVVSDLETTRPDFVRRNLGQLPVESALLRVPEHALASAWATVPFEEWITYLRVAPDAIKTRAISVSPARLRDGLVEELALRVTADPDRATEARRKIVRAALTASPRGQSAALGLSVVNKREVSKP
jgi:flagellar motor switch protein FliG